MKYVIIVFTAFLFFSCGGDSESLTPEEYIAMNNLDATELENGVYIVIDDKGSDVKPNINDVVEVDYIGKLTNGEVFDSDEDFKALLSDLIPGWYIGLKELGEGGSCTLIIPYA
ncbi:MAG: FKBP-type peptidyl-prolyl cis-trans isomerase, partial [Saprospiraceae bacterium]|nr:FKBP-type peptidyl-prolyl cis-trans isomerase [Saprospiraceae bacterium]